MSKRIFSLQRIERTKGGSPDPTLTQSFLTTGEEPDPPKGGIPEWQSRQVERRRSPSRTQALARVPAYRALQRKALEAKAERAAIVLGWPPISLLFSGACSCLRDLLSSRNGVGCQDNPIAMTGAEGSVRAHYGFCEVSDLLRQPGGFEGVVR